jgi:predicted phosphodiesterase
MNKLGLFLGDIHGDFNEIPRKLEMFSKMPGWNNLYQVGDFGLGFRPSAQEPGNMGSNVHFIRGNHDDPARCRLHPNYMGDYGITPAGIFFVSGAWSIDQSYRIPGVSWWKEEELSEPELQAAYELYVKEKPRFVMSHTCPEFVTNLLIGSHKRYHDRRTENYLQRMWQEHRPETWVFGHWHTAYDQNTMGTRFVCLEPEQAKLLPI